jgi:hypothetical protein
MSWRRSGASATLPWQVDDVYREAAAEKDVLKALLSARGAGPGLRAGTVPHDDRQVRRAGRDLILGDLENPAWRHPEDVAEERRTRGLQPAFVGCPN